MNPLRVVALVSSDTSDIFFANQLTRELNVVGIVVEQQYEKVNVWTRIVKAFGMIISLRKLFRKMAAWSTMKYYGEKAAKVDEQNFGEDGKKLSVTDNCKLIFTQGFKAINDPVYIEEIKKLSPDVIAVCGTSILKEDIISIPPKGILNLHGGLSQKYRGVWTTYWALLNEEPEYIGATVHYVSKGIDDGEIIFQGRPNIEIYDNPEKLYTKVVRLGIRMMVKAIKDIESDRAQSYPPEKLGDLYLDKMMTPEILKNAWEKSEQGTIKRYLEEKSARDDKVNLMLKDTIIFRD